MKSQVTFNQFVDGFSCRPDNFTYSGLRALYDAFEEIEEDIGNEITFDPIGICCEFTEYANLGEYIADYGDKYDCYVKTWQNLQENTWVIPVTDNRFIIQAY